MSVGQRLILAGRRSEVLGQLLAGRRTGNTTEFEYLRFTGLLSGKIVLLFYWADLTELLGTLANEHEEITHGLLDGRARRPHAHYLAVQPQHLAVVSVDSACRPAQQVRAEARACISLRCRGFVLDPYLLGAHWVSQPVTSATRAAASGLPMISSTRAASSEAILRPR
jgi:hypothetical protein